MKKLTTILFSVCLGISLYAQKSLDIFTVTGHFVSPSDISEGNAGEFKENFFNANLKLPIVLSESIIWFNDFNYYQYHVNGTETSPFIFSDASTLHGLIVQTGIIKKVDNKALMVFFMPRLMGDLKYRDTDNFQYGGMVLVENMFSENLTMRFGATYNTDLFGPYIVPLVYLDWHVNERFFINGLLPIYSKIGYNVNDKFDIGIHHVGLTTSFNLSSNTNNNTYIERNSIDLSVYGRYKITKSIHIETRLGYSLGRGYDQYTDGDEVDLGLPLYKFNNNRNVLNSSPEGGTFILARLIYSLTLDK